MNSINSEFGDLNALRILRSVWLRPGISRTELARNLRLDKSTVTKIVSGLLEIGVVTDLEKRQSGPKGGRKPISLVVRPSHGCVLGFELQADMFRADVVDLQGDVLMRIDEKLAVGSGSVVERFRRAYRAVKPRVRRLGVRLVGMGLGLPGIVDPGRGVISWSVPLRVRRSLSFFDALRGRDAVPDEAPLLDGVPVLIDNDARCGCWSVVSHHRGDGPRNFLFLFGELRRARSSNRSWADLSIGIGIVLNGRVYYGDRGASGEFISVFREAEQDNQFSVTDEEARRITTDAGIRRRILGELARNVSLLLNVLNMDTVFIGGSILSYAEELIREIEREVRRRATVPVADGLSIRQAAHGEHVVAYGAAGMVLERLFTVPDVTGHASIRLPRLPSILGVDDDAR